MLEFLFIYALIGFILSFLLNAMMWSAHQPALTLVDIVACILFWPTVLASFINSMNGIEEDLEE